MRTRPRILNWVSCSAGSLIPTLLLLLLLANANAKRSIKELSCLFPQHRRGGRVRPAVISDGGWELHWVEFGAYYHKRGHSSPATAIQQNFCMQYPYKFRSTSDFEISWAEGYLSNFGPSWNQTSRKLGYETVFVYLAVFEEVEKTMYSAALGVGHWIAFLYSDHDITIVLTPPPSPMQYSCSMGPPNEGRIQSLLISN